MKELLLFILYKIVKFILLLLSKNIIKKILDLISELSYFFTLKHRKIAMRNLDFIYDNEITREEKKEIVKDSYKNLSYNLYSFFENQNLELKDYESRISIKNEHYILNLLKNNRKIILITGHYGNWEYGNTFIPLKYGPTTMVGRKMNNKYLNKELNETRTKNNTEMLEKNNSSKGLIKALKNNRIVGLVIDQNTNKGIKCNFLGKEVIQIDSASRLAVKFNASILPIFFTMNEFGKYTLEFYKPIEQKDFDENNKIEEMTKEQSRVISEHIFKKPGQWFWQHRRFKTLNKEIY